MKFEVTVVYRVLTKFSADFSDLNSWQRLVSVRVPDLYNKWLDSMIGGKGDAPRKYHSVRS